MANKHFVNKSEQKMLPQPKLKLRKAETGELKVQKSTFIWNISDFSKQCGAITSPYFQLTFSEEQSLEGRDEWYIELFPFGKNEDTKDYLSVFLIYKASGREINEKFYFELSILDDIGNNVNSHKCTAIDRFKINECQWGWGKFIKRNKLFNKKASLLLKDTLKISCFIHVDPCDDTQLNNSIKSLVYQYIPDQSIYSLVRQYQDLFLSEEFSDLTIVIDDKEIKTHKSILSARSKVFSAMLKHNMKESKSHTITIADIEYEVMKEFLLFLYCRTQVSHENAKSLLEVADKYDVDELKIMCEKTLWNNIDIHDACEILSLADRHNCKKLCDNIINYIITNAKEVIKTEGFEELSNTHPMLLKEIFCCLVENRVKLISNSSNQFDS